jgi:hypothetical protein
VKRFFFHVYDDAVALDKEGVELLNADVAKAMAVSAARALAADQVRKGALTLHHRIGVTDDTGAHVATVEFRDAVNVEGFIGQKPT